MFCIVLKIFFILISNKEVINSADISVTVKIMEETSPDFVFHSLKAELREKSLMSDDFIFLNRHPFVNVKPNGDMTFRERIDLETICSLKQICCGVINCIIKIYIPLQNQKTGALDNSITVDLEIIDKNDNMPQFRKEKLDLSILESAKIGFYLPLESAVDHDFSSTNRIHDYRLVDPTNTFQLKFEKDKSNYISIQLDKSLDFEIQTTYQMVLLARDPDFTRNQTVTIHVQDENDNFPKFEFSLYNISIKETIPLGFKILKIKAVDLDKSIKFSTINYLIDSKTIDSNVLSTFHLNELTGALTLQQPLNAKIRNKFIFQVIASDSTEGGNSDSATVSIDVKDENNNAPVIDVLYPNSGEIKLFENQPPQQIAILTVTDNDLDVNALTTCKLKETKDKDKFSLQSKTRDLFSIHSLKQFDYEKEQICFIQIQCHDFGSPSLTTIKSLKISIIDENEHSPVFTQLHYRLSVKENTPPNTPLMQITAYDEDKNATLRYNFDNQTENIFLKIDTINGWISTSEQNIDREKTTQISQIVTVTDTLDKNAKTASVSVNFQVADENDNKPEFIEKFPFKIRENALVNTMVGRVRATDADEGGADVLQYKLLKTWSSRHTEVENLFDVKSNGVIDTKGDIDRELDDNFTLLIAVSDEHFQTDNFVTTNITITISDENDNAPIWLMPSFANSIFNITNNYKVGDPIIQLIAKDADAANNGKVQYYLTPNDPDNDLALRYFLVNSTTGIVYVLHQLMDAKYRLSLEAVDFGNPVLKTSTVVFFRVYGQISQTLKIAVVVSIITVTGIISVFLIIAIICVRKHPNRRSEMASDSNTTEKEDSYLKSKSTNYYVPQTPDFLTLIGSDVNGSVHAPMLSQSCQRHMAEYLDAESGDSGNGPSEEGLSSHYVNDGKVFLRSMNQSAMNYSASPFIQTGIYPHSCFSLPENSVISQISEDMLIGNSYYDLSTSNNRNLTGLFQKIPSMMTNNGEYPMQNLYSQLSQI